VAKIDYSVNYKRHHVLHAEEFPTIEQAFNYVDRMENGVGGYATAIYLGNQLLYERRINEEAGTAYWFELETGNIFGKYRN
jgi:hypothetical protein